MLNQITNKQITDKATLIALVIIVISWATPQAYFTTGAANILLGAVLIGMNLVRYAADIKMSRSSFLIGAFLFNMGLLEGATLYNPIIFPLFGLMMASYGIYNWLSSRQS